MLWRKGAVWPVNKLDKDYLSTHIYTFDLTKHRHTPLFGHGPKCVEEMTDYVLGGMPHLTHSSLTQSPVTMP